LSEQYKVCPNQIGQCRAELLERATEVLATVAEKRDAGPDVKTLHAKIGQLALENDFLAGALGRIGDASAKRRSIRHTHCRCCGKRNCWNCRGRRSITNRSPLRWLIWR
jgi:hypothetical protein